MSNAVEFPATEIRQPVMNQLRVVHIINLGGFGGAEKLLIQLLPALSKEVQAVCLLCFHEANKAVSDQIAADLEKTGVEVHQLAYKKALSVRHLRNLQAFIGQGGYDVIHSHLQHANLWIAILRRTRRIKTKTLTTLHGYRDSYQNANGLLVKTSLFFTPYYWVTRFILKNLDGHIAISNCLKSFFIKAKLIRENTVRVIYHGYQHSLEDMPAQGRKTGSLTAPKIVLPGRIIKLKGHIYAVQMLSLIRQRDIDATLHFFGDGPYRAAVQAETDRLQLKEYVFFHGYVHELQAELRQCDIAVIPSSYESFGMVFLDCYAAALPVVAFDLPAGNEIVENGMSGLLTKPHDAADLAEKVLMLCENPVLRDTLTQNGQHFLTNRFSMQRMATDYVQYYLSLSPSKKAV